MLARIAGGWTLAVGLGLAAWTLRAAGGLPVPLIIALLGAAALEIGLGVGVVQRSRAAWAYAMSLTGVLSVALLIALPAFQKSGASWLTVGLVAAVAGTHLVLLVIAREDLRRER